MLIICVLESAVTTIIIIFIHMPLLNQRWWGNNHLIQSVNYSGDSNAIRRFGLWLEGGKIITADDDDGIKYEMLQHTCAKGTALPWGWPPDYANLKQTCWTVQIRKQPWSDMCSEEGTLIWGVFLQLGVCVSWAIIITSQPRGLL